MVIFYHNFLRCPRQLPSPRSAITPLLFQTVRQNGGVNGGLPRVNGKPYLFGNQVTLADVHVFPHLVRFDPIFYRLFGLTHKHLDEYQNLSLYMKRLESLRSFSETVNYHEMIKGGFQSENNLPEALGIRQFPVDTKTEKLN